MLTMNAPIDSSMNPAIDSSTNNVFACRFERSEESAFALHLAAVSSAGIEYNAGEAGNSRLSRLGASDRV